MSRFGASLTALLIACGIGVPAKAIAQENDAFRRDRNVGVRDRPKPEYNAPGIPAGGFVLQPELGIIAEYNDNVFATDGGEQSDAIGILQARARLQSQWSTHALGLNAGVDSSFYSKFSDENTTDWNLGANGRLDIERSFYVNGTLDYAQEHEDRASSPTSLLLAEGSGRKRRTRVFPRRDRPR